MSWICYLLLYTMTEITADSFFGVDIGNKYIRIAYYDVTNAVISDVQFHVQNADSPYKSSIFDPSSTSCFVGDENTSSSFRIENIRSFMLNNNMNPDRNSYCGIVILLLLVIETIRDLRHNPPLDLSVHYSTIVFWFFTYIFNSLQQFSTNQGYSLLITVPPDVTNNTMDFFSACCRACQDPEEKKRKRISSVISEPIAAALYYHYDYRDNKKRENVFDLIVCDFGDSCFKCSLVHIDHMNYTIKRKRVEKDYGMRVIKPPLENRGDVFRLIGHFTRVIRDMCDAGTYGEKKPRILFLGHEYFPKKLTGLFRRYDCSYCSSGTVMSRGAERARICFKGLNDLSSLEQNDETEKHTLSGDVTIIHSNRETGVREEVVIRKGEVLPYVKSFKGPAGEELSISMNGSMLFSKKASAGSIKVKVRIDFLENFYVYYYREGQLTRLETFLFKGKWYGKHDSIKEISYKEKGNASLIVKKNTLRASIRQLDVAKNIKDMLVSQLMEAETLEQIEEIEQTIMRMMENEPPPVIPDMHPPPVIPGMPPPPVIPDMPPPPVIPDMPPPPVIPDMPPPPVIDGMPPPPVIDGMPPPPVIDGMPPPPILTDDHLHISAIPPHLSLGF